MDVCVEPDRLRPRRRLPAAAGTSPTERQTSVPDLARDLAPPTRFGRYVFAGEIGAGGMGVVYAAHDPELDRMVAVKLLRGHGDARLQQRLRREAQVMARLAHPHVVAVHDVGSFEGRVFVAMEYVDGETLAQWITRPRSVREILAAYCAAGRGLAAAHAAGIVHRDFKPENVLVGKDGRIRVGDFGLARSAGVPTASCPCEQTMPGRSFHRSLGSATGLTASGVLVGTRYYMAPELYKGVEADARSDQFSFCVALSAALAGKRVPVGNPSTMWSSTSVRVPRRIRAALRRGLSLDPAARFASLDELLAELESSPRRRALWVIAAAAALVVIAIHVGIAPASACDAQALGPVDGPVQGWSSRERIDVAKPSASALTDPVTVPAARRVAGGAAGVPRGVDAARCATHAPRRMTRTPRHVAGDVRRRPVIRTEPGDAIARP